MDQGWLLLVNSWHAPWLDQLMWGVSRPLTWVPLYVLLLGVLVWQYGCRPSRLPNPEERRKRLLLLGTTLAAVFLSVALADYLSSGIIKPWVARLRPTHDPLLMDKLHLTHGYRGGRFGFVSSHAANTMAVATICSLLWHRPLGGVGVWRFRHTGSMLLALWVVLNCYSRMYLGVHYPLDILGGLTVGFLVALLVYALLRLSMRTKSAQVRIAHRLYYTQDQSGKHGAARPAVRFAMAAITIGMIVMIITLAVVIGFKRTISDKVAGFGAHIEVLNFDNNDTYELHPIHATDSLLDALRGLEHVESAYPFATKPGMLKTDTELQGIIFRGSEYRDFMAEHLVDGQLPELPNQVLLSRAIASKLLVNVGDTIFCYFIEQQVRTRKLIIVGLYDTGYTEADELFVMGKAELVRQINQWKTDEWSGIEIRIDNLGRLEQVADNVYAATANRVDEENNMLKTETLIEKNPQIFAWLDLLDMNVVVIIVLMLLVSGFSIVTGLIILILDHISLIGTLKALGANNHFVRKIFITEALMLIGRGILLGNIIGLALCYIQYHWHVIHLDPATYYVNYAPIAFPWMGFVLLNVGTILFSLIILLAPSAIVSRISPARVMHFE